MAWPYCRLGNLGTHLSRPSRRSRRPITDTIQFIGIGICLAYWIDYAFSYVDSQAAFRAPIGLQLLFAVIVTLIVFGLPESPRWLAKRGREKEATEVLCTVFDLPEDDDYVQGEMEAIRAAIAIEQSQGAQTFTGLFKKDILQTRWRVFLAWFGLFMNQWSGVSRLAQQTCKALD